MAESVKDDLVDPKSGVVVHGEGGHDPTQTNRSSHLRRDAQVGARHEGSPAPTTKIPCGSFGMQKAYMLEWPLVVYTAPFLQGNVTKLGAQTLMKLRKPLKVPVDQDCTISKRVNGRWNLQRPLPRRAHTRSSADTSSDQACPTCHRRTTTGTQDGESTTTGSHFV